MFSKFKEMSWDTARYEIFNELDNGGPIGEKLIMYRQGLPEIMMQVAEMVDYWKDHPLETITADEKIDFVLLDDGVWNDIVQVNEKFCYWVLTDDTLNWDVFLSAWITFFKTHYTTLLRLFSHLRTPQNQDLFDEYTKYLTNIMQSLDPVLSLLELTVSYKALFQATAQLLDELHTWRQSRPAAIRLSEAYLNSIGYYNNRE